MKKPILYHGTAVTRFGETDSYGHINSKHFLDYVISMRWDFAEKSMGMSAKDLIAKGLGFFMTRSEINYKRSIDAGVEIHISSHIEEIKGSTLIASFKIEDLERKKLFSDGKLIFAVIDLKTMRPQDLPEWAEKFFFEM